MILQKPLLFNHHVISDLSLTHVQKGVKLSTENGLSLMLSKSSVSIDVEAVFHEYIRSPWFSLRNNPSLQLSALIRSFDG